LPEPSDDDLTGNDKLIYGTALIAMIASVILIVTILRTVVLTYAGAIDEDTIALTTTQMMTRGAIAVALLAYLFGYIGWGRAKEAWAVGKGLVVPLGIVGVVLGSIYGGALMRTYKSTGTILWVTFGATALAGAYTIIGGPTYIANLILGQDLPTLGVLMFMMVIFLFLGAFMDWVGIVLLIMPVFLPIVLKLPVEDIGVFSPFVSNTSFIAVWFGILFCVNMQVSFLSPPFGPAAFYLKSVAPPHITLPAIFKGFLPFISIQLIVLMLILFFPELTMFFK